jgi:predicted nucleic acid-binding protein
VKKKLFFDADVILDIATDRRPYSVHAAILLSKVEEGVFEGFTSSTIITNIYYVLRKLESHRKALLFIKQLRLILKIIPVDDTIILKALESSFHDFEDGVQYHAALAHRLDYIITRNTGDYKKSSVNVCTPEEFLKINFGDR